MRPDPFDLHPSSCARWRVCVALLALSMMISACTLPVLHVFDRDAPLDEIVRDDGVNEELRDEGIDGLDVVPADVGNDARDPSDVPSLRAPTASCPVPADRSCGRVFVAGGTFTLGTNSDRMAMPTQPDITVSDFVIDATEVSVGRFRRFHEYLTALAASGGSAPDFSVVYPDGVSRLSVSGTRLGLPVTMTTGGCNWRFGIGPGDLHPINCIDWPTALAFCIWDGGRLPTEAEYEWVARWWNSHEPDGREFPWGSESPRCDLVEWGYPAGCPGEDMRATVRVASLTAGAVHGVFELAGNVGEWLADIHRDYVPESAPNGCWGRRPSVNPVCTSPDAVPTYEVRGGAATIGTGEFERLRTYARRSFDPTARVPHNGVRCVRGP